MRNHLNAESKDPATRRVSSLSRAGLLVASVTAGSNALHYLYQVIMSRQLGPSAYGALGALLAFTFIFSVPGLAVQTIVARHTALRDRDGHSVAALWSAALRGVILAGLLIGVIAAAASPILTRFLHTGSIVPALWLAASLVPALALPAVLGMLQGRERFGALVATVLVAAAAKLAFGAGFVAMGLGVSGGLAGAAMGPFIASLVGLRFARPDLARASFPAGILREMAAALFAIVALSAVVNLDIILARHFLDRRTSGLYAVGTVVSKLAYWAPRFVVVVSFPRLATLPDRRPLVSRAAAVVAGFSVVLMVGAAATSRLLLGLVFGKAYEGLGSALWLFAGIGTAFALVHLLLFSGIAAGDLRMTKALGIGVLVKTALIVLFFHHSVVQIATVVLLTGAGLLAVGIAIEYANARKPTAIRLPEFSAQVGGDAG